MSAVDGTDIAVKLERPLPHSLPVGRGTAVFCYGHCFHRRQAVEHLEMTVDGRPHPVTASRMPRLDLVRERSDDDPELRCYRSGFWATIPIEARDRPGSVELRAWARLADGSEVDVELGTIEVVEPDPPPTYELPQAANGGLLAVCMATFNPDLDLFRAQIDSLRAQTDTNWICLVSDDCSRPDRFEAIVETLGDDRRFALSRSEGRLGFYRNFERAVEMVPREAELVALCDQDDRWYPDKLAVLREAIGTAELVYSDQRLVDPDGRVLRESFWEGRRNNHTNLASEVIANTIVGAASVFRRRMLDVALPFPEGVGWEFHDHWLGIVAMATGEVAYVDRPLYDYVQHRGAVLGKVTGRKEDGEGLGWRPRLRGLRGFFARWRAAYFLGYVPLEVQSQALLARCGARLSSRKRRVLRRFVASSRSPFALAWLAARPVRELFGRNETLGTESVLLRGILWRHLIRLRVRGRERPNGATYDASLPSPYSFQQKRLRRWQAGRIPGGESPTASPPGQVDS